jgi:amino acid transporter
MGVLAEYIFITLAVLGLLYLRKSQPDLPRPIKVNLFYPITFLIVCFFIIAMTLYQIPQESFMCLAVLAAGVPVYYLGVKWKKPESIQKKLGKLNFL